jgi:hypothetical protein
MSWKEKRRRVAKSDRGFQVSYAFIMCIEIIENYWYNYTIIVKSVGKAFYRKGAESPVVLL